MSFTRFHDDPARIKKELQESTGAGRYVLNTPGPGDKPCYMEDPYIRAQKWGVNIMTNTVDIETELWGLSRQLTRDTHVNEYRTPKASDASRKNERIQYPSCSPFVDQSRATHPAWMARDLEQDNWKMLPLDPQRNVFMPFQNYLSTRILEKDHFVPSVPDVEIAETHYPVPAMHQNPLLSVGDFRQTGTRDALFS
jgi:hypothetical protein